MGFLMTATRRSTAILAGLMLFALVAAAFPGQAFAAGVVGDGTPGSCTEAALVAALASGGAVTFNCGPDHHTISFNGEKIIAANTSIVGGGKITLHGESATRLFTVNSGVTLTLAGVTLAGGAAQDGGAILNRGTVNVSNSSFTMNAAIGYGGVIYNVGGNVALTNVESDTNTAQAGGVVANWGGKLVATGGWNQANTTTGWGGSFYGYGAALEVTRVKFTNNAAFNGGAIATLTGSAIIAESSFLANSSNNQGGAVMTSAGTLNVSRSTFFANSSIAGGAIHNLSGTLTLRTSTISDNTAISSGGGVGISGSNARATLSHNTITNNVATHGAGGIDAIASAAVEIAGTVVAHSTGGDCNRAMATSGFNLSQDASCGFTAATDMQNTHPLLGPLTDNGGPTLTRMPEAGSPTINAGGTACESIDQIGRHRPMGGGCDMGAVEYSDDTVAPVATAPLHTLAGRGSASEKSMRVTLTWSATDDSGTIAKYDLQRKIDGGNWTNVQLADPTKAAQVVSLAYNTRYTFRVRATDGAGNVSAWAAAQQFALGRQEEDARSVSFTGSWKMQKANWTFGGATAHANTVGSKASFAFEGTSIAWVAIVAPGRGKANVVLDGVFQGSIDLNATTTSGRQIVWLKNGLTPGLHTLEIRVRGASTSSPKARVDVTGFITLT